MEYRGLLITSLNRCCSMVSLREVASGEGSCWLIHFQPWNCRMGVSAAGYFGPRSRLRRQTNLSYWTDLCSLAWPYQTHTSEQTAATVRIHQLDPCSTSQGLLASPQQLRSSQPNCSAPCSSYADWVNLQIRRPCHKHIRIVYLSHWLFYALSSSACCCQWGPGILYWCLSCLHHFQCWNPTSERITAQGHSQTSQCSSAAGLAASVRLHFLWSCACSHVCVQLESKGPDLLNLRPGATQTCEPSLNWPSS